MRDLYGLFGEVLAHSYSPKIHQLILQNLNLPGFYHLFELPKTDLKTAVEGLKVLGAKGINVTIPHKISIMDYIDEISPEASRIGSVNTIAFENGRTRGYNTDYFGIDKTFKKYEVELKNKKAVVLGNGGAAVTLVQYLQDKGIGSLTIVSRNPEKSKTVKVFKNIPSLHYDELDLIGEGDVIINCTPCGMYPHIEECPVPESFISKFKVAFDLIYNPPETEFLKYAGNSGLKRLNGLYMLVSQAISAQEIWNKINISEKIIDEVYAEMLKY